MPTTVGPRRLGYAIALVALLSAAAVALWHPGLIRFWPFGAGEFVQTITPLFLISLFIERTLEVFVTSWRGPDATQAELAVTQLRRGGLTEGVRNDLASAETKLADYKSGTQRIAFAGGVAIGLVVSALGVRALGLFVDPSVFGELSLAQRSAFNGADVILTGTVLGGGAEGLHKLVTVFTNFLDTTARKAKQA